MTETDLNARPIITLQEWADRVGVSRQRASEWMRDDRLPTAYRSPPTGKGIILIPALTPRPAPLVQRRGKRG